jgi:ATP-dependent helicase/DNAse subunit B
MIEDSVRTTVGQRLFPTGIALSASALETYARCPFRYFLNTVLGVVPQEDPELLLTLQPRERGALLYEILHDFFSRLQREGRMPLATQDPQKLLHVLQTVAHTHFAAFAATRATGLSVVWEVERAVVEQLSLL